MGVSEDSGFLPMISVARRQSPGTRASVPATTLLEWGTQQLLKVGLPPVEAKWLLEWSLGVQALELTDPNVGIRAAEKYRSAIAQRRARVPLQHITAQMAFRYLTLKSGPGVFVVRPETEMLVDLGFASLTPGPAKIVDLCAGSGAIGLAVVTERADSDVTSVEVDAEALRYLNTNVSNVGNLSNGSRVTVVHEDAMMALVGQENTFDLVLSNPPYVGLADAPTQPEALIDPPIALYGGGEDGLVTPRGIVNRAYQLLKPDGALVMEHGSKQGGALVEHALSVGFIDARTVEDLTGTPRFLVAHKGPQLGLGEG